MPRPPSYAQGMVALAHTRAVIVATALAWIMTAFPGLVVAGEPDSKRGDQSSAAARVAEIARLAETGANYAQALREATDLGGGSIQAALDFLDENRPARAAAVHELIAGAARSRGWHPELIRRYDPTAARLYTGDLARDAQARIADCLTWKAWHASTPDALVRAAPEPTLAWLEAQSRSDSPDKDRLQQIWRAWGLWARSGRESQPHIAQLRDIAAESGRSDHITRSPSLRAALAKFIGEIGCTRADPFLGECLVSTSDTSAVEAAASALRRIAADHAPSQSWRDSNADSLRAALDRQSDPAALQAIITALEAWPDATDIGDRLLASWNRFTDAGVRRALMYSAAPSRWRARAQLIKTGLHDTDGSVVGAALQAIASRAEPGLTDDVLRLAEQFQDANPHIIDALASLRDGRALPRLQGWEKRDLNVTLQIKLIGAMKNIPSSDAHRALMKTANTQANPAIVEQAIAALESSKAAEALPLLLSLARDRTAPTGVRMQSIRAISAFESPDGRKTLGELSRNIDAEFGIPAPAPPGEAAGGEAVELARTYLAVARLRLKEPTATDELNVVYRDGGAGVRFTTLILLASMRVEHPVIDEAIRSHDFAAMWAGLRAARANEAKSHSAAIRAVVASPFINHLRHSAIDTFRLDDLLSDLETELNKAKSP